MRKYHGELRSESGKPATKTGDAESGLMAFIGIRGGKGVSLRARENENGENLLEIRTHSHGLSIWGDLKFEGTLDELERKLASN